MKQRLSTLFSTLMGGARGGLLFLALVATTALWAEDFSVGGIYYNILTDKMNEVEVTYGSSKYTGSVAIPTTVSHNGTTYSVTSIGGGAFYYCSSLTSVTIPNSVTSIGGSAFSDCTSLRSVTIPNSVTKIGMNAFAYCSSLTSITIPNSVTSIKWGYNAFTGCSSLSSIVVESGNSVYDSRENCNAIIETATNTLITGCQNTIIPNSVTNIGFNAFDSNISLTSITIPNSVTSIGSYAFFDCSSLTSITIPNSVTSIGINAFQRCTSLSSIIVDSGNAIYDSRDNCNAIIETTTNTLIVGCQNTIIPNSVTSIGDYAFFVCFSLNSITIPNSVTSIGSGAFRHCRFTSITLPKSITSIGDYAFADCSSLDTITCLAMTLPALLGEDVFYGCDNPTLFVPCAALSDYQAHKQWGQFATIECIASEEAETEEVVIESGTTTVQKVMRNGQLIILRDGVEYNAMGQEL